MYRKKMSRKRSSKVFKRTAMKVNRKKITLSLCEAVIEYNNEMLSPSNGLQNRW